jgi:hypothetical protein
MSQIQVADHGDVIVRKSLEGVLPNAVYRGLLHPYWTEKGKMALRELGLEWVSGDYAFQGIPRLSDYTVRWIAK